MSRRASAAGSFEIFGPGTSTRQVGMSPRAKSSRRITSFSCLSDGTSSPKRSSAWVIWAFVSAVDMSGDSCRPGSRPGYVAQVKPTRALLLAVVVACSTAGPARGASTPLLPDLVQAYPREVQVETDASSGTARFDLGFLS